MTRNVGHLLNGAFSGALAVAVAASCGPGALAALAVDDAEVERQVAEKQAEAAAHQQIADEHRATAYELAQQIEERQAAYAAAQAESDEAQAAIDENEARIAELEREIPQQQERSDAAARERYKFQQGGLGLVDVLLGAVDFSGFLAQVEYLNRVSDAQVDEIVRLAALKAEVDERHGALRALKSEAEMRAEEARVALVAAEDAQAQVQARIEEEARLIAEITAMAEELAAQPRDNDKGSIAGAVGGGDAGAAGADASPAQAGAGGGSDGDAAGADAGEAGGEAEPAPAAEAEAEAGGSPVEAPAASGDEASFVAEWTARIDAYLAGSPLAGQGATFARAAYAYGVDPRLSPAISFTESGKGAVCFLPHNAWGWGSCSWGSWEEAIDAHVAGLARGYGGQLSVAGAQKYCPPNWQGWYDRTLGQMELI